jgi:uncharacterized protein (TIGR03086 family)
MGVPAAITRFRLPDPLISEERKKLAMDSVALMKQVIDSTDKVVKGTTPDQLRIQSPCTEWTVRDVINHITGGSTMFAVCVEEGSVPDDLLGQLMTGDNLGDDYIKSWEIASSRAVAAFESPGALDKTVKLPFGEMPAGIALNIAVFDVLTHAADIATATGQTIDDTALVETALELGHQMVGPDLRVPGVFDAEQPAPDGSTPVVRLLAFAGRKV